MTEARAVPIAAADADTTNLPTQDRWLFVDGASDFGGHEVMLLRWLEELTAQRAITPILLAREGSQLAREGSAHAVVHTMRRTGSGLFSRLKQAFGDAFRFAQVALQLKPQLCVVAEGCLLSQPVFAFVARLLGLRVVEYVPLMQTSTSMGFGSGRFRDAFVRRVYRRVLHGWIAITKMQADEFRAWAGVRRPIFVLPNTILRGIENEIRDQGVCDSQVLRVLVLGRIEAHQKGLDTLLSYLLENPSLSTRMQISFVGSGPFEATIRAQLTHDAALARWVSLRPWTPSIEALKEHDVLLMTSRYEGVPLVMLEAMAVGIPVVAPDLPGTRAFLDADSLFPVGAMPIAFDRVTRLMDPRVRTAQVSRNRQVFEQRASNAAFSGAVRTLTQQLRALGRAQRRSA